MGGTSQLLGQNGLMRGPPGWAEDRCRLGRRRTVWNLDSHVPKPLDWVWMFFVALHKAGRERDGSDAKHGGAAAQERPPWLEV